MLENNNGDISTVECKGCGKKYAYKVCDCGYPGSKEREYANCPYCKAEGPSAVTNGVIYSYKLDADGCPIESSRE